MKIIFVNFINKREAKHVNYQEWQINECSQSGNLDFDRSWSALVMKNAFNLNV